MRGSTASLAVSDGRARHRPALLHPKSMLADRLLREKTRTETIHQCSVGTPSEPGRDKPEEHGDGTKTLTQGGRCTPLVSTKTGPTCMPTQGDYGQHRWQLHLSHGNSPRFSVSDKSKLPESVPSHTYTRAYFLKLHDKPV